MNNPDWEKIDPHPTDLTLRNRIGKSLAPAEAESIGSLVGEMLKDTGGWREVIEQVRSEMIFNLGHGGAAAGEYLLSAILEKQEATRSTSDMSTSQEAASL